MKQKGRIAKKEKKGNNLLIILKSTPPVRSKDTNFSNKEAYASLEMLRGKQKKHLFWREKRRRNKWSHRQKQNEGGEGERARNKPSPQINSGFFFFALSSILPTKRQYNHFKSSISSNNKRGGPCYLTKKQTNSYTIQA